MNGSVANIVYHVSGDKLVQLSAAFGGGEITWDNLTLTKGSADEMLRQLEECNHAVEERLKRQTDESLKAIVASWGGKKMTAENLFLMLIEHDLYHAGQVRYIRNLLEKED